MATSISGDDIKTITRYYADPAQPNMGDMRIIDLIKRFDRLIPLAI